MATRKREFDAVDMMDRTGRFDNETGTYTWGRPGITDTGGTVGPHNNPTGTPTTLETKVGEITDPAAEAAKAAEEEAKRLKALELANKPTEVDNTVQSMIDAPAQYLIDNNLEQEYTPGVVQAEELLDVNGHAIADPGALTAAEAVGQDDITAAAGVTVGAIGTQQVEAPDDVTAAADVTVGDIDVQQAADQAAIQAAADVTVGPIDVAAIQQQQALKAAEAVKVAEFTTSLINPNDLTKAVDEIAKLEPMKAASMSAELDGLLEGMEEGNVPLWARPAVTKVEQMLAGRGISASSIGRDALFNAIIQSAMPIAQQDATFKQESYKTTYNAKVQGVLSDVNMEFAAKQFNATSKNQAAQFRVNLQAQVDMNTATRQDSMSQFNSTMRFNVEAANTSAINAASIATAQLQTNADISNATRKDAATQFNANTQLDIDKFNATSANTASINQAQFQTTADISNATRKDTVSQFNTEMDATATRFNAAATNQATLTEAQLQATADIDTVGRQDKIAAVNAEKAARLEEFNVTQGNTMLEVNAKLEAARTQFNATSASLLEQSNMSWRRQVNESNTAGENAVNQANVQNAFNLSNQGLTFLWQEQRDEAHWEFQATESEKLRKAEKEISVLTAASEVGSEAGSTLVRMIEGSQFLADFLG